MSKRAGLRFPGFAALAFVLCSLAFPGAVRAADEVILVSDPLQLEPTAERALVYVLYSGVKRIDVFLDRTPVASLNDTYVAVRAEPGPRVLWGTLRGRRFDFEPGKTYVLAEIDGEWRAFGGRDLAGQLKARRIRWAPPSTAQLKELERRLAAGEYPWALEVLGVQLPARFGNVLLRVEKGGSEALAALADSPARGSLKVDGKALTYDKNGASLQIPTAEIRVAEPAGSRTYFTAEPKPVLRVVYGPAASPIEVSFQFLGEDFAGARAAVATAVQGSQTAETAMTAVTATAAQGGSNSGAALLAESAGRVAEILEAREADALREPSAAAPAADVAAGVLDLAAYFEGGADRAVPWLRAAGSPKVPIPLAAIPVAGNFTVGVFLPVRAGFRGSRPALIEPPPEAPAAEVLARQPEYSEIPGLLEGLESRLASEPGDLAARLLAIRLGTLQEAGRSLPSETSMLDWLRIETDARVRLARLQTHVDEALKAQPDNASAHLGKARLDSLRLPRLGKDGLEFEPRDLEGALRSARRATELAPAEPRASLLLARLLFEAGKPEEAVAAARQAGAQGQAVADLIADLLAVPLPPGAAPLPEESRRLGRLLAESGWLGRFPDLRVRTFALPGTAEGLQTFFRRSWPKHAFFRLGEKKLETVQGQLFGQHLRWKPQGLEPTGNRELLSRHEEGLGIFLLEMANLPYGVREVLPAAKAAGKTPGGRICIVSVVTFRPVP
ncbi:MAG TPA: hypothetical protein VGG03_09700 [Thermoanaerobaculia bacterium]|jgi:tetratricopeptide (TPR) repeat protein